jgi:large subunit ribosomal protein L25
LRKIVDLKIEGDATERPCLLKSVEFDPVTDEIVHIDLIGIKEGYPITIDVPFKLVGQPVGVRQGGKLQSSLRKVKVTCMPEDLVEAIEVDVTNLGYGKALYIRDLENVEKLKFAVGGDTAICMVNKPRVVTALAEDATDVVAE